VRNGSGAPCWGSLASTTSDDGGADMGLDRSLDQEGIPDLEGPLPAKVATGDPQEGTSPPSERPAAADYGVTAEEQSRPEPLDERLARERPDVVRADPERVGALVAPEDEDVDLPDDDGEVVARDASDASDDGAGESAEEAAMHIAPER
jgi:hypothetical protein